MNSHSQQEGVQGQPCPHLEAAEVGEEHHQEVVGAVVECCHQLPYLLPLQAGEAGWKLQTGTGITTQHHSCWPTLQLCPCHWQQHTDQRASCVGLYDAASIEGTCGAQASMNKAGELSNHAGASQAGRQMLTCT